MSGERFDVATGKSTPIARAGEAEAAMIASTDAADSNEMRPLAVDSNET